MTPDTVIDLSQQTLYLIALITAPMLLSALAIGLIIGMFQAATSINEQTLSFIPKLMVLLLSILRQALGTAQTPSNQIILGLALFLTLFVMSPVFDQVYQVALQPYLDGSLSALEALRMATEPFKTFMLAQTRETDIRMFADIAGVTEIESPEQTPLTLLMPAFVTSELKTAFQIGFLIFIPFVIIDLVVASVLMSMGMMMLSPMIISLPFKLMLFVLVDGWALIMGTLASSFLLGG